MPMRPAPNRAPRKSNIAVLRGKRLQAEFQEYTFQLYALLPNGSTFREEYFEFVWSEYAPRLQCCLSVASDLKY
jgi:hypothetical protein